MRILVILSIALFLGYSNAYGQESTEMQLFEADSLIAKLEESERPWLGFFRNENLTTGIYSLDAGAEDKQSPHDTDEIYYVIEGVGKFECNNDVVEIKPGSILYVPAHANHRFIDIKEKLVMLVFFD